MRRFLRQFYKLSGILYCVFLIATILLVKSPVFTYSIEEGSEKLVYELFYIFFYYFVSGILLYHIYQTTSLLNMFSLITAMLLMLFILDSSLYLAPIVAVLPVFFKVNNGRGIGYGLLLGCLFIYVTFGYIPLFVFIFIGLAMALSDFLTVPRILKAYAGKKLDPKAGENLYIDGKRTTYADPYMPSFQAEFQRYSNLTYDSEYLKELSR